GAVRPELGIVDEGERNFRSLKRAHGRPRELTETEFAAAITDQVCPIGAHAGFGRAVVQARFRSGDVGDLQRPGGRSSLQNRLRCAANDPTASGEPCKNWVRVGVLRQSIFARTFGQEPLAEFETAVFVAQIKGASQVRPGFPDVMHETGYKIPVVVEWLFGGH